MKKKKVLVIATLITNGLIVASGIVVGAVVFSNRKNTLNVDPILTLEAKKISADYDNKAQIEASKIEVSKLKFKGLVSNNLEINVKNYKPSKKDSTILDVIINLKNVVTKKISDDTTIEIKGFKRAPTSYVVEELDKEIEKITSATYNGNLNDTEARNADRSKIVFSVVDNKFEVLIKSLNINVNDLKTLLVTYTLRAKGGILESHSKIIEISGFKRPMAAAAPLTKNELDKIAQKITKATYKGDKTNIAVSDAFVKNITLNNLSKNYVFDVVSFTEDSEKPTTAVLQFTIKQLHGFINSDIQTINIEGFRKPYLTTDELNKEIDKITEVTYGETKKETTELKNIDNNLFKFQGLPNGLIAKIENIQYKEKDNKIIIVTIVVKEPDGKIMSKSKNFEITGFKNS